mmetsp:Transcript_29884/g.43964  ORF Transcript_29884/g.43964 Transcript_29884/m.43964 type:complete len:176 (-) Transcript_29884:279-806(-)|eukprot:scaffold16413_cov181-Skeletonema_dohrnii-CCMP3373.AAC.5
MAMLQCLRHRSSCCMQSKKILLSTQQQNRIAAMSTVSSPSLLSCQNVSKSGHSASLVYNYQGTNLTIRRQLHNSTIRRMAVSDVKVTLETASSNNSNSTPTNNTDDSASSGSSCSQGIPLDDEEEEEEQEEMFVTADPVLGHGTIKEWGGPRRGGSLAEPTRFGDWERKGRCTDF